MSEISTARDERSRTFWFGFVFFIVVTSLFVLRTMKHSNHEAAREVCRLIRQHYFRASEAPVQNFLDRCDREAEEEPWTFSRTKEIERINRRLSALRTSHLAVYTPVENRQMWANQRLDTGIRARRIEGEIVIYQLIEESPAVHAGLKVGDAIVSVAGDAADEDNVMTTAGTYKVARGPKLSSVEVGIEDISEDLGPRLVDLANGVSYLRLGSFLPQYFSDERWRPVAAELGKRRALIVDLRQNAGGSFPAALRALSPFFCKATRIGSLWTKAEGVDSSVAPGSLADDLRAVVQIDALGKSSSVSVGTFEGYGCFSGPIVVLVDEQTSSVAEVFSQAMMSRPKAKVWGVPTSGHMVLAQWFEIGSLGGGDFAMSIPVAGYHTTEGLDLENLGVQPQKILSYSLERALKGEDNWLSEAARDVSK